MKPAELTSIHRDLVVVGCSAGGVDALPRLLQPLPKDLPATICIVQHMAASDNPYLVNILSRASVLPVSWAEQGGTLERGHVYVAPPDTHLLLSGEHLRLTRGARENHARPSIDKLFRSAAAEHGARVIGVLLTGMLDDGVAGLQAIHTSGGVAIVQDPEEAAYPELPRRALLSLSPDRVLPILGIATALVTMTQQQISRSIVPSEVALEAAIDATGEVLPDTLDRLGPQTSVSCADCKGPTWLIGDEHARRYRCYLGHVNSARDLLVHESLEVETALWSAVRALSDRATTLETLATDATRVGRPQVAELYAGRAKEARSQADLARKFLTDIVTAAV